MTFTVNLRLLVVVLGVAAALGLAWLLNPYTIRQTPDGFLVLNARQSAECDEGGGCAVFSQREFGQAVNSILSQRIKPI
jgi:hypothetical protein